MKLKLFKRFVPLFLFCFGISLNMGAQNISINYKDTPIKTILKDVTRQSGYTFVYSDALKEIGKVISITYMQKGGGIELLLKKIFAETGITWSIKGKQVALLNNMIKEGRTANENTLQLKGVVKDEMGESLPGVAIHNKTTGKLTASDLDGAYSIEVKEGDMLFFSSIGMANYETVAGKSSILNIFMKPDAITLDDVVVTGYQTISKERATGSFETIGAQQLNKPSTSLEQSIIGNVSGIQVVNKGYGDREESIVIRGVTSLGANSNPLVIVDGFAIEGTLSSINPNDIAGITVLKDAAAASIWGARSANGVIVVTTKSSQQGKVNVELNAFVKFSGKMNLDYANPLASSAETIEYEKMGFESNFFKRGSLLGNNYSSSIYNRYGRMYSQAVLTMNENRLGFLKGDLNAELNRLSQLDNRQQITDNLLNAPITQQYNLTIQGGTEKLSNILTLMFDKNITNFKRTDNQRYTFNYRTNLALFKWLDVSVSTMFQYSSIRNNGVNLADIQEISPYDMLIGENGEYLHVQKDLYLPIIDRYITQQNVKFPYSNWGYNPVQEMRGRDITSKSLYGRVQAGLKVKIMKGLTFDSKFQYEIMDNKNKDLYSEDTYQVRFNVNSISMWNGNPATAVNQNYASGMAISEGSSELNAWNLRNQFTFDRTFGDDHMVSVIAGTEVSKKVYESTSNPLMYGYSDELLSITPPLNGISSPNNPLYNMFGESISSRTIGYPIAEKMYSTDKYFSLYGNISYTYKQRYTVSGSYRTDASNLISSNPAIRYSPFWSVGAAWNMTQESFMKNISWINRLVLRTTYGFNGNVDKSTSVDPLISIWSQNPETGTGYGIISNYGNPNLGWEKTGSFDVGVDFALLNNKLNGKIDYYNKQGRDLISTVAIANVYGSDTQSINAVSMYNKGIEITVGSFLQKGKFSWSGNLSFAYNKNKITKLFKDAATLANRVYGPNSGWEYTQGYDAGTLWAFKYGGLQEVGGVKQPVIVDKDGKNPRTMAAFNTSFDSSNYLIDAGTATPPYVLGLNSSFRYGNFNFSFIITGYFGHKFKRTGFNYPIMDDGNGAINKYYSEIKNCNPNEFAPLPIDGMYPSRYPSYVDILDYQFLNAANIRFQEINLTYDLPKQMLKTIGLGGISVYGQLNNVGVITFNGYGQDPFYPMGTEKPRIAYTFGAKINF
ncbi:MAG: SusC/RagA family TonB-linked outer membrane protein [Bacteroidales bacterium]